MVVYDCLREEIDKNIDNLVYKDYLAREKLRNFKPVEKYDENEILAHTLELLTGIDILCSSKICVLDYQSNVSRFIKLAHNDFDNVIDINGDNNIDLDRLIRPTFSFQKILDL